VAKRAKCILAAALVLGLAANIAYPESFLSLDAATDKPLRITAKKAPVKLVPGGGEVTFEGLVRVQQGDVTMTCDKLVVVFDDEKGGSKDQAKKLAINLQTASSIRSITASGNVALMQSERKVLAGKAFYDKNKRTITLTDGPKLWQGPDKAIADTIIIYLDENRSELLGRKDKPIKMDINPGKQKKIGENGRDKEKR